MSNKQSEYWVRATCVKCGKEFLFAKDSKYHRCTECENHGKCLNCGKLEAKIKHLEDQIEQMMGEIK